MVELEELMKLLKVNNQMYAAEQQYPPGGNGGIPLGVPAGAPVGMPVLPQHLSGAHAHHHARSGSSLGGGPAGPMVIVSAALAAASAGNYDDVTDVSGGCESQCTFLFYNFDRSQDTIEFLEKEFEIQVRIVFKKGCVGLD